MHSALVVAKSSTISGSQSTLVNSPRLAFQWPGPKLKSRDKFCFPRNKSPLCGTGFDAGPCIGSQSGYAARHCVETEAFRVLVSLDSIVKRGMSCTTFADGPWLAMDCSVTCILGVRAATKIALLGVVSLGGDLRLRGHI